MHARLYLYVTFGHQGIQAALHICNIRPLKVNDLPNITDIGTKIVFFSDDTSIIVSNSDHEGLQTALNKTLSNIISWFKANFLLLNFNRTYYLEFRIKKYKLH